MELVLIGLKSYLIFVMFVMILYTIRHFIFTYNRTLQKPRISYHNIVDSDLPSISVLIPMHNEERVAEHILNLLVRADYPRHKMEIIPINDHSKDETKNILNRFARKYSFIHPLHRDTGIRGKPAALNEAMKRAKGELILVFDADYLVPKHLLKAIAVCFKDPEVGAVMGRVVPVNTSANLLTRLLDMERSGGYQVDQQARHNLKLIPQFGGTTGGFRKDLILKLGGFDPNILAEDTDLTFQLFIRGWHVLYSNEIECYEEAPEEWAARGRQIRRWARGHTQVFFKSISALFRSPYLRPLAKCDGLLLLSIFFIPFLLLSSLAVALLLFFMGELYFTASVYVFLLIATGFCFGNFAPFYQIGAAMTLDGSGHRLHLLPFILFSFFFNIWHSFVGCCEAICDQLLRRTVTWSKTPRFRKESTVA